MRFAFADPPYPGQAKKHYADHPDYAGEVDHAELIAQLAVGGLVGVWSPSKGESPVNTETRPLERGMARSPSRDERTWTILICPKCGARHSDDREGESCIMGCRVPLVGVVVREVSPGPPSGDAEERCGGTGHVSERPCLDRVDEAIRDMDEAIDALPGKEGDAPCRPARESHHPPTSGRAPVSDDAGADCSGDAVSEDEAVEAIARAIAETRRAYPQDAAILALAALDAARPYVERETVEKIVKALEEKAATYKPDAEAARWFKAAQFYVESLFGVSP